MMICVEALVDPVVGNESLIAFDGEEFTNAVGVGALVAGRVVSRFDGEEFTVAVGVYELVDTRCG